MSGQDVRFHNEASDTARINDLLIEANARDFKKSGDCIAWLAKQFVGLPYKGGTLEGEAPGYEEFLTVDLDELDCTTLVDNVLALAYTVGERRSSWRDFVYNLERLRYRNGKRDGYASRLHYFSAWVVDNVHRGTLIDATQYFPKNAYQVKSIDFMSENRSKYPALADDEVFNRLKSAEIGFRNHRYCYIKAQDVGSKHTKAALRDGDIVAFTTKTNGLDVAHMGVVVMVEGEPRLLHASSSAGVVMINSTPLEEVFRKNHTFTGMRVVRLKDW